jgi:NadR type nicotinamide-nucleotide adenylyltransferase
VLRIAITGPESTGKSELAEKLSAYYRTVFVPEVAREYLEKLGRPYIFEDIVKIAKKQLSLENSLAAKTTNLLFCDTDILVTKVWSKFKFGKCDLWIEEMVNSHRYDLYLLCDIDLPWMEDPLRENPFHREELFGIYLKELQQLKVNFAVISGIGVERSENAF